VPHLKSFFEPKSVEKDLEKKEKKKEKRDVI